MLPPVEPSPLDYLKHAKEANRIAGIPLQLELPQRERSVEGIRVKFSLGLSLQAGELAGKAMLRSLGFSADQIRRDHRSHNLPTLLDAVQAEATRRGTPALEPFQNFLCTQIEIEGEVFGNTIGSYLDQHFASGPAALPRSYFYPDESVFMKPDPYSALFEIVNGLIEIAENLEAAVNGGP